jgi:hypothetical protein
LIAPAGQNILFGGKDDNLAFFHQPFSIPECLICYVLGIFENSKGFLVLPALGARTHGCIFFL